MSGEGVCSDGNVTEEEVSGSSEFALRWAGVFTGPKKAVKGQGEGCPI